MNIIRFAIENPIKVTVMVLLVGLFGFLSLFTIPIQLIPNVDRPLITVTTNWVGATPQEVEDNVIRRQEEKLKSVSDLVKMTSVSRDNQGVISLEFGVGVDKDVAVREVSDKLRQVSGYEDREAIDEPVVEATETSHANAIAWLMFSANGRDVTDFQTFCNDTLQPILERVPGVASAPFLGGREKEGHVIVEPARLAARRVTFAQLEAALRSHNVDVSAGTSAQGKRELAIRTVGKYETVEEVLDTVIVDREGGAVYVRDVADVVSSFHKQLAIVRGEGELVLACPVQRETGTNVLKVMQGVQEAIERINNEILIGPRSSMRLEQVYDETIYIESAVALVEQNIVVGGLLAILVLMLFLRSPSATLVVAVSIPISVVGTFLVVKLLNRNINVVMLAGMAFAVGMVVDAAVVVLENVYRHVEMGKPRRQAALEGAREVWGAVLAGTLTTMAVFIPVLTIEEEAGQLFRDIAIAISSAVGLSLIVAVTVIPTLSARVVTEVDKHGPRRTLADALKSARFLVVAGLPTLLILVVGLFSGVRAAGLTMAAWLAWLILCLLAYFGHAPETEGGRGRFARAVAATVGQINRRTSTRLVVVVGLTAFSIVASWALAPPSSYLPTGNRNFVFGILLPPPGYSLQEFDHIGTVIEGQVRSYWQCELNSPEHATLSEKWVERFETQLKPQVEQNLARMEEQMAALREQLRTAEDPAQRDALRSKIGNLQDQQERTAYAELPSLAVPPPPIDHFFYVSYQGLAFMGAISKDENVALPLANLLNGAAQRIPDVFAVFFQPDIFGVGRPGDNLDVDIRGDDLDKVTAAAGQLMAACTQRFGSRPQPDPVNFSRGRHETRFEVDPDKSADLGMTVRDVGFIARAAVDGAIVGEFREAGKTIDLMVKLKGTSDRAPNVIEQIPVCTPTGRVVPLGSIAKRVDTTSLQQINRIEEQRAVTLQVYAPKGVALDTLQTNIAEIVTDFRQQGLIDPSVTITFAGNADKLKQTRNALVGEWKGVNFESLVNLLQSRFFLATLVVFLLMAGLFESFLYPFVIMFSVPLAAVGGFVGIFAAFQYSIIDPATPMQMFDVLTGLGFIILLGIVVNNAILIVHQALNNMRDGGMPPQQAITESVRTRIRPIFMTSLTSICGMGPLCLRTGAGSELYRGLGSVIVGGLLFAMIFTLLLVPALFSLALGAKARALEWLRGLRPIEPAETPARANPSGD